MTGAMVAAGERLASVIITNYNYAGFLPAAIESALAQTHRPLEVVVVDDGSTDASRQVIARYGERLVPVLKANGGQDSALNAGYAASRGDVVCFLDADDLLDPGALASAVAEFAHQPDVVKVHWPLRVVDASGHPTGALVPRLPLPEGDLLDDVVTAGPGGYLAPPTSGNAWSRRFLDRVLPIPVGTMGWGGADMLLSALAPVFGRVARLREPHGGYRYHGGNAYWGRTLQRLPAAVAAWEEQAVCLARLLAQRGIPANPARWRNASWFHRLTRATGTLRAVLPPEAPFILVDEDQWALGDVFDGRRRLPFLERDGVWWGLPADDTTAVHELERLRTAGAAAIVFAWPSFWWLTYYTGFARHLRTTSACLAEDEDVVVLSLDGRPG